MRRTALPFLALIAACGNAGSAGNAFVVRDSAGVRIAESSAAAWQEGDAWIVEPEPALRIGVVDGAPEYLFQTIRSVRRLPDGRIVVADNGTAQLRWYDASGRHLKTAGGHGGGPGEMQFLDGVLLAGDSVVAYDYQLSRLLLFDSSGAFMRHWKLEWPTQFAPLPIARLDDGTWISRGILRSRELVLGYVRSTGALFHFAGDGAFLDTLVTFPAGEAYLSAVGPNNQGVRNDGPIYGLIGSSAAAGSFAYVGNGDGYDIRVHDVQTGALVERIRRMVARTPVTDENVTEYLGWLYARYPEERQPEIRRIMADVPAADSLPSYVSLRLDEDGNLWVERYRAPWEEIPHFDVFDRDGRYLGEVVAPRLLVIHQIGPDFVTGTTTDENDVQFAVMHRINKPD